MATKKVKEVRIEETLWAAANKLRGSVESAEYKHIVLSLIFLKFISDKFTEQRKKLIEQGHEEYLDMQAFYEQDNVFFLPEETRWSYIQENASQDDIATIIDEALINIEKQNKSLKGALPNNYFAKIGLDNTKLKSLIDTINNIDTQKDKSNDIIGRIYEYFLAKFAIAEGKGKGEFYTPKSIVNLIAELIEPYKGKIYDPCCGSGGMFIQSLKFVEEHQGNKKDISIYGQEYTNTTYKIAKMNLAFRGLSANLGVKADNTFANDQHPDLKADYIMANPPFNQKDWRASTELTTDPRWAGYDVPPTSNANYGWILHMASKLSENGVAGFILANGALSGGGDEAKIRQKMLENNLVEAVIILPMRMFYSTDISVTLWILNKNKKERDVKHGDLVRNYRNREKEVLFMDLRKLGIPFEKKYIQFSEDNVKDISKTYHTWQQKSFETEYKDIPEFCYSASLEEIAKKDYSLVPSKYIEFVNQDENIDFDTKMQNLQSDFTELLQQEEQSKQDLLKVFKELGYEIKL